LQDFFRSLCGIAAFPGEAVRVAHGSKSISTNRSNGLDPTLLI